MHSSRADSHSSVKIAGLAAGGLTAAILAAFGAAPLAEVLGVAGTVVALALMWAIALGEVIVWVRISSPRSMGLKRLGLRDAAIAIIAGIVLALLVPLLSLGVARLGGVATGTVETAAQLNVGIACSGSSQPP